jgi:hypothetical protein
VVLVVMLAHKGHRVHEVTEALVELQDLMAQSVQQDPQDNLAQVDLGEQLEKGENQVRQDDHDQVVQEVSLDHRDLLAHLGQLDPEVKVVNVVRVDNQENLDLLDLLEPLVLLAPLVLLDQLVHQDLLAQVVHLALQDLLDPEVTEENQVPQGLQENLGAQDQQDHLGHLDLEVQRGPLVSQAVLAPVGQLVHLAPEVSQDHLDLVVREGRLGHQDQLDRRVLEEILVKQDPPDLLEMEDKPREESLALLVRQVPQESLVDLGQQVQGVTGDKGVKQAHLESVVALVHLAHQVPVDSLDKVVLVEKEAIQVFQAHQDLEVM